MSENVIVLTDENAGKTLKMLRKGAGLTLDQLGAEIGYSGPAILRYEHQDHLPQFHVLNRIAASLGYKLEVSLIKSE